MQSQKSCNKHIWFVKDCNFSAWLHSQRRTSMSTLVSPYTQTWNISRRRLCCDSMSYTFHGWYFKCPHIFWHCEVVSHKIMRISELPIHFNIVTETCVCTFIYLYCFGSLGDLMISASPWLSSPPPSPGGRSWPLGCEGWAPSPPSEPVGRAAPLSTFFDLFVRGILTIDGILAL